jgi:hypothetical protein
MTKNIFLLISFVFFVFACAYTLKNYRDYTREQNYWGTTLKSDREWLPVDNNNLAHVTKTESIEGLMTKLQTEPETFSIELTNHNVDGFGQLVTKVFAAELPRKVVQPEDSPYSSTNSAFGNVSDSAETLEDMITKVDNTKWVGLEAVYEDLYSEKIIYIKPALIFAND